jgi:hypothetical protein
MLRPVGAGTGNNVVTAVDGTTPPSARQLRRKGPLGVVNRRALDADVDVAPGLAARAPSPHDEPTRAAQGVLVGDVHATRDGDAAVDDQVLLVPAMLELGEIEAGLAGADVDPGCSHAIEEGIVAAVAAETVKDHANGDAGFRLRDELVGKALTSGVVREDEGLQVDRGRGGRDQALPLGEGLDAVIEHVDAVAGAGPRARQAIEGGLEVGATEGRRRRRGPRRQRRPPPRPSTSTAAAGPPTMTFRRRRRWPRQARPRPSSPPSSPPSLRAVAKTRRSNGEWVESSS